MYGIVMGVTASVWLLYLVFVLEQRNANYKLRFQ